MTAIKVEDIIKPDNLVYKKSSVLTDVPMHYCYGCSHGVVHKLIAEVIEEMNIQEDVVGVAPVGCAVMAYYYLDIDWMQAAHGRAPAVATGYKRVNPKKYVFSYQGDGDLAAIGTAETMHAVNRGENIVMIFINNAIYGMTGGQMAPTSLVGQVTATSPHGRDVDLNGYPLKITELVAQLPGAAYVTRQSVHTPGNVRKTKKAIRKAFENCDKKIGTSFIEVVSTCNSGWKIDPVQSNEWMVENMFPFYPLGDIKDGERDDVDKYLVQKLKK
ncbi:MAG: thiamine pyrophosphate-dependent enzyme [Prolixibacteraceae bacterium]|jgi:2-oxoglutarate ferredoxin oxidoreductase subunit beta|nr:thiamine pyrophosphate-dependent enzyme [Prolixibacteraceae bacterium]